MRVFGFIAVAAAVLLSQSASAAAWQQYVNEPLGYSVHFPGPPTEWDGVYSPDLLLDAKAHNVTFKDENNFYVSSVIETNRNDLSFILVGEYEYWLAHLGDIVLNNVSRLTLGREYGRFITLDCRDDVIPEGPNQTERAHKMFKDAFGIECPNGARLTTNLFFAEGKLYAVTGINLGPNAKTATAAGRFANSIAWEGANSARARTLVPHRPQGPQAGAGQAPRGE